MNETEVMNGLDSQNELGHVEASDIFREDLVLDQHGHEISAREEFHEHVEESRVLERSVQFDQPRAVGICQNVSLSSDVGQLVLFELRPVLVNLKEPQIE